MWDIVLLIILFVWVIAAALYTLWQKIRKNKFCGDCTFCSNCESCKKLVKSHLKNRNAKHGENHKEQKK